MQPPGLQGEVPQTQREWWMMPQTKIWYVSSMLHYNLLAKSLGIIAARIAGK